MTICGMPYEEGDDYSTIWRERLVKARKEHKCCECGGKIQPGEQYGYAEALYDGEWTTWKRCPSCLVLAELAGTLAGECALWGLLREQVSELNRGAYEVMPKRDLPTPEEHRKQWEATE